MWPLDHVGRRKVHNLAITRRNYLETRSSAYMGSLNMREYETTTHLEVFSASPISAAEHLTRLVSAATKSIGPLIVALFRSKKPDDKLALRGVL